MTLYLLYADRERLLNSNLVNSVLVEADDETVARQHAHHARPSGEVLHIDEWACVAIAPSAPALPRNPLFFDGSPRIEGTLKGH